MDQWTAYWSALTVWGKVGFVVGGVILGWTLPDVVRIWDRGRGPEGPIVVWGTAFVLYCFWVVGIL